MKIEVLFPEVANLYGDLQNAEYLRRCCADIEIVETTLKDTPCFLSEEIALVYMGSVTEEGQRLARDVLLPHKDAIRARIEAGQLFLITGNAMDVFGEDIFITDDGSTEAMLGLFPLHAKYQMMKRCNALYLGSFGERDIVGFKSLFGLSYGEAEPLFTTARGYGRNKENPVPEGVRDHRFFATHLTGPLLILNPPFAKYILSEMGVKEPRLAFEDEAMELYRQRVKEFGDPDTGVEYH